MTKRSKHPDSDDDLELPKDASGLDPFERLQLEVQVAAADPANQEDDPELEITPLEMEWYRWQARKAFRSGMIIFIGSALGMFGLYFGSLLSSMTELGNFEFGSNDNIILGLFYAFGSALIGLLPWGISFPKKPIKSVIDDTAELVTKGGVQLEGLSPIRPPSCPAISPNKHYAGEGFFVSKFIGGLLLPTKLNSWTLSEKDLKGSIERGIGWHWVFFVWAQGGLPVILIGMSNHPGKNPISPEIISFMAYFVCIAYTSALSLTIIVQIYKTRAWRKKWGRNRVSKNY